MDVLMQSIALICILYCSYLAIKSKFKAGKVMEGGRGILAWIIAIVVSR